jgi:hypothetical protein
MYITAHFVCDVSDNEPARTPNVKPLTRSGKSEANKNYSVDTGYQANFPPPDDHYSLHLIYLKKCALNG